MLPPHVDKKWAEYQIISDEGHLMAVNFTTGCFVVKSPGMFHGLMMTEELNKVQGVEIQPVDELDSEVMTFLTEPQDMVKEGAWVALNGLPYFPVVGRRVYKGDLGGIPIDETVYYCGWQRKKGTRTITKMAYLYPNGRIAMT